MEIKDPYFRDLHELQMQIQKRLDERPIEETYRHAFRLGLRSQFNEEVLEKVSNALRFDTVSWLIRKGYELRDIPQLFTQSFDYGNEHAVAIKIEGIKEQEEFPIAVRMLLMLVQANRELKMSLLAKTIEANHLEKRVAELTRPSLWSRITGWRKKLREEREPIDDRR